MLFMHKGADDAVKHAVYTGERPKDNEDAYYHVTPELAAGVWDNVAALRPELGIPDDAMVEMRRVFSDWVSGTAYDASQNNIYAMMSKQGMDERARARALANWRYYNNYVDLVLALYGEVTAARNLKQENEIATLVLRSQRITDAMRTIAVEVNKLAEATFTDKRDGLVKGAYATLHVDLTWAEWKERCATMSSDELVPFLYDITMSFKKPLKWSEPPMDDGKITKDNMRVNVSTPDEDFYWTSRARWADVPVWAAPSYTAELMLRVATIAKVPVRGIQAFAYAIYAYWNRVYPHTATPVHRMYEVMTTAKEFGVEAPACDPKTMYAVAMSFAGLQSKL